MSKFLHKRQKMVAKQQALVEITRLLMQCETTADPQVSKRFIRKIWRLATHHRIRLPSEYKRRFCRHCFNYFVYGTNCRVRLQGDHIVLYCLGCKHYRRFVHKGRK